MDDTRDYTEQVVASVVTYVFKQLIMLHRVQCHLFWISDVRYIVMLGVYVKHVCRLVGPRPLNLIVH